MSPHPFAPVAQKDEPMPILPLSSVSSVNSFPDMSHAGGDGGKDVASKHVCKHGPIAG